MSDQLLEIGARIDLSGIIQGMPAAANVTAQSTAEMAAGFRNVTSAAEATSVAEKGLAASAEMVAVSHRHAVSEVQAAGAAFRTLEGGIPIRAIERFSVNVLGMGPILQAAFPVIGGLIFAEMLGKMSEKLYTLVHNAHTAGTDIAAAFDSMHLKATVVNDDLRIQSDRLQQEIDKLEGVPDNGVALALDESRKMADQLLVSLEEDGKALDELLQKHDISAFASVLSGVEATGQQKKELEQDQKNLIASVVKAKQDFDHAVANTSDPAAIKAAGEARDRAISAAFQTQIEAYKREAKRLKDEQDSSAAYEGADSADATRNAAKIANIEGATAQLQDALDRQNLAIKVAGLEERKGKDDQAKRDVEDQKRKAREAKEAARAQTEAEKQASAAQLRGFEDALTERKLEEGAFYQQSAAEDAAYWKNILDTDTLGAQERHEINGKYLAARNAADKQALDTTIAAIHEEIEEQDKGSEQIIGFYQQIAASIAAAYGPTSREAMKAQGDVARATREVAAAQAEIAKAKAEADARARKPAEDREMGTSSKAEEMLRAEQEASRQEVADHVLTGREKAAVDTQTENTIYQMRLASLQRLRALQALDPNGAEEVARTDNQIQLLEQKHQDALTQIASKGTQERAKLFDKYTAQVGAGITTMVQDWTKGDANIAKDFSRMLLRQVMDLEASLMQQLTKRAQHYVLVNLLHIQSHAQEIAQKAAAEATLASIQASARGTTLAVTAMTNTAQVASLAGVAGAAATASTAAIPIVGPALAPEAGAAMIATTLGIGSIASAEGGWAAVPADNTLTNLHKNEMVLPSDLAGHIRKMTAGNTITNQFGGNTINGSGEDFAALLDRHEDSLAYKIASLQRDGRI